MDNRKMLVIPESKDKIKKIKEKYNNMSMSDNTANKIIRLEATNSILKKASTIAGVLFAIDMIVPDPVIGLDEALLGGITAVTKSAKVIIDNKIEQLATSGNATLQASEIRNLSDSILNLVNTAKKQR